MSRVTNLIIATSISEDSSYLEKTFNDFKVDESPFNLVSVESEKLPNAWYGGSKFLEVNLFVGAYNYLDLDSLPTNKILLVYLIFSLMGFLQI